ncbi:MAG: preprotein translocase subunit SecG [Chloroflexi bacterium]|nr:MAG: preprotein translocase subunit SecG [Chloroflexota bacterium]
MDTAVDIAQVIIAVMLIVVVLTQTKGSGFSGAFGGDTSSIYRTRRGIERTLFNFTIGLAIVFVALAILVSTVL